MKTIIATVVTAAALATPLSGFAQQDSSAVTRAQVRADLVQVEQAGYTPSIGEDNNYPKDIQGAEQRVAMQQASTGTADGTGGVAVQSASGHRFARAMSNECVGPVSYCNLFFGS
jgi:hypothetical protein